MERVLVVPTELILAHLGPAPGGFHPGRERALMATVAEHGRFEDRPAAELNVALKQIIPYGMILCRDEILLLRRLRGGGETRLHEKTSIGVGGHVNPPDAEPPGARSADSAGGGGLDLAVARAFERELHEELTLETEYSSEPVGVLNDDSNPVGRVHVGIVYKVTLKEPKARVREAESLAGSFVTQSELSRYRSSLETWSGFLQEHYWP